MSGGKGSRIQSVNSTLPKPLIPIKDQSGTLKPVLQYEIESLVYHGLTDIIINVSYKAEKIRSYFGDGSILGAHISYFVENQPLGNAGAIVKMVADGTLDSDFLLLNADSMFDVDFHRFMEFHKSCSVGHQPLATLFTHPNSHPQDSGLIITDEQHVVTSWLNKEDVRPEYYKNRVNAGLHILSPDIIHLANIDPDTVGVEDAATGKVKKVDLDRDIIKTAVSSHLIYAYDSPEYVKDMGTPERFYAVCSDVAAGRVRAKNLSYKQRAIFLDRDGTINKYVGFVRSIDQFELLPGVAEGIRLLNEAGWLCIVISNQPVIARGEVTVGQLEQIHNKMETLLGLHSAYLDAIYYCPHHPDAGYIGEVAELKFDCDCRKPKPGLLNKAAQHFNIDLQKSWMVGDSWRDVAAGKNAGTRTGLIKDSSALLTQTRMEQCGVSEDAVGADTVTDGRTVEPDITASSLLEFVKKITIQ